MIPEKSIIKLNPVYKQISHKPRGAFKIFFVCVGREPHFDRWLAEHDDEVRKSPLKCRFLLCDTGLT